MATATEAPTAARQQRPQPPSRARRTTVVLTFLALVVWAAWTSGVELSTLLSGPEQLIRIAELMFTPPDWTYTGTALAGFVESLQIAWIGTLIGALCSLPLALLAARNVTSGVVSTGVRQILNAVRAVPDLILAIIFVSMIGLGPLAGTIAIGLSSIGTLGKLSSEAVESIDRGPLDAVEATGGSRLQVMRWGVLPQVLPEFIAFWLYRFEINLRASAILGIVGAGGVGGILQNTLSYRRFDLAGMTIIVIVIGTILVDMVSGAIRRRVISGRTAQAEDSTEDPAAKDPAILEGTR